MLIDSQKEEVVLFTEMILSSSWTPPAPFGGLCHTSLWIITFLPAESKEGLKNH